MYKVGIYKTCTPENTHTQQTVEPSEDGPVRWSRDLPPSSAMQYHLREVNETAEELLTE